MTAIQVERKHQQEAPPFPIIWDEIKDGRVVPFLGAGASLCGRPVGDGGEPARWTGAETSFLPNGPELGKWLAAKCMFPDEAETSDLAKIASYYEIRAHRTLLVRRLRDVFSRRYSHGPIHDFLAESPKPLLIVTTNYDTLIEQAFQQRDRPYHLVTHPERDDYAGSVLWWKPGAKEPKIERPRELPLSLEDTSIIYKMHGTVNLRSSWNSFVITEEDYVRFLASMTDRQAIPARFMMHFQESAFLFLGYGLRDWNLRVLLENLHSAFHYDRVPKAVTDTDEKRLASAMADVDLMDELLSRYSRRQLPSWAIQHQPSDLEKTLWNHRKVQIFDMALDEFVARMRDPHSWEDA
jgi:hypothetical protein